MNGDLLKVIYIQALTLVHCYLDINYLYIERTLIVVNLSSSC